MTPTDTGSATPRGHHARTGALFTLHQTLVNSLADAADAEAIDSNSAMTRAGHGSSRASDWALKASLH
jgi:hypothetical protein